MNHTVNSKRWVIWHACCFAFLRGSSLLCYVIRDVFLASYVQSYLTEWIDYLHSDSKETYSVLLVDTILNRYLTPEKAIRFYPLKMILSITWLCLPCIVFLLLVRRMNEIKKANKRLRIIGNRLNLSNISTLERWYFLFSLPSTSVRTLAYAYLTDVKTMVLVTKNADAVAAAAA